VWLCVWWANKRQAYVPNIELTVCLVELNPASEVKPVWHKITVTCN